MTTEHPPVTHSEDETRGAFRMEDIAVMTYTRQGEQGMTVNHTKVVKAMEGRGLARVLYHAMVDFARKNNRKVTPTCSYVVAMFKKFPEDGDVLA